MASIQHGILYTNIPSAMQDHLMQALESGMGSEYTDKDLLEVLNWAEMVIEQRKLLAKCCADKVNITVLGGEVLWEVRLDPNGAVREAERIFAETRRKQKFTIRTAQKEKEKPRKQTISKGKKANASKYIKEV